MCKYSKNEIFFTFKIKLTSKIFYKKLILALAVCLSVVTSYSLAYAKTNPNIKNSQAATLVASAKLLVNNFQKNSPQPKPQPVEYSAKRPNNKSFLQMLKFYNLETSYNHRSKPKKSSINSKLNNNLNSAKESTSDFDSAAELNSDSDIDSGTELQSGSELNSGSVIDADSDSDSNPGINPKKETNSTSNKDTTSTANSSINNSQVLSPDLTDKTPNSNVIGQAKRLTDWSMNDLPEEYLSDFDFQTVRDWRFLDDPDIDNFLRRIPWLYPDDGCYNRAELVINRLSKINKIHFKKIFAFGDLKAKSNNSKEGSVSWWYHVAVTFKHNNEIWIIDPALEPEKIITVKEWQRLINFDGNKYLTDEEIKLKSLTYSLCDKTSYQPADDCYNAPANKEDKIKDDSSDLLFWERKRIKELNRNPDQELGDFPPWKN